MPFSAVSASSDDMFLNDERSPASPARLMLMSAAASSVRPMLVPISPNCDVISSAALRLKPNCSVAVSLHAFTLSAEEPNATSTLLRFSSKSLAALIAAADAATKGNVTAFVSVPPARLILPPVLFRDSPKFLPAICPASVPATPAAAPISLEMVCCDPCIEGMMVT